MKRIRILMADDSIATRRSLQAGISQHEDLELIGTTSNGLAALDMLKEHEPDVLILDLILPHLDGFGVMESMEKLSLKKCPDVFVLSALSSDEIVSKAMQLGARYYMVKPYECDQLVKRIRETVCGETYSAPSVVSSSHKSVDEKVASMFLTIGIPAHIKGYQYLREAVKQVMGSPDMINRITKELYPTIAKKFDTSSSKVERAIRHAIEVAWSRGRIEIINQMFGHCVYTPNDKPTNGEFIALIADKLIYEHIA
ncbi:MAG: sporulation transcription factor Spo0A [Christensenellales bacterium]|jgi:two-component system response regulator (stage 0 sporulation protein A)